MGRWRRSESERGTASVEFVGLLPALILAVLVSAQLLAAGFSLWSASVSARAGARAVHVGTDPVGAARRALPKPLRAGTEIRRYGSTVAAHVAVPRLLPILPVVRVKARSRLGAGG